MKSFLDAKTMAGYKDMDVEISGSNLKIPATINVGDELPNGYLNVSVKSEGTTVIEMSTVITKRKVEAMEEITTDAGTFNCYKISYTTTVNMIFSVRVENIDWISEGIGTVKSETYSKGKVMGYTVLSGISK